MDIDKYSRMNKELQKNKKKQLSKGRLRNIIEKRLRTSFIGALSFFEEFYPDLVDKEDFQRFRTKLLDNGNNQIRLIDSELINYDVEMITDGERYTF